MLKFILIFAVILYILYRLFPFLLRLFIMKKAQSFSQKMNRAQQQQQQKTSQQQKENSEAKIFSKAEGEYVQFEEVEEDTEK